MKCLINCILSAQLSDFTAEFSDAKCDFKLRNRHIKRITIHGVISKAVTANSFLRQ